MPVNDETLRQVTDRIVDTYKRFALGNEGFVHVDRFDVHYPEVDFKITVRARETARDPLFRRRHTIYSITSDVEGTIDLENIQNTADKLTLTIHTPVGNPSLSLEDAIELATFIATALA
ncbi:hypothetical protein WAZ07_11835 [Bacillus sp. FJAT-51639]|uniref:Uncharacterized protein n=1 Tax=Bacillus bruguierae TaxID=3127667 RepID=A0ABU8FH37_9BACI